MSSSSSSSSAAAQATTFSLDHLSPSSSEQLCYVHCNFCDTVLAVSVPYGSLLKSSVTVRCGHCSNLLNVINIMRALHLPQADQLQHHHHHLLAPSHTTSNHLLDHQELPSPTPPSLLHLPDTTTAKDQSTPSSKRAEESTQQSTAVNRPPEKRQRVPSAYNRFIKDEIQRIKAGNPDITHREAFSAAAKNWAHFPHIHLGLTPDQRMKNNSVRQQDFVDHEVMLKDGFHTAAATAVATANMGLTPF